MRPYGQKRSIWTKLQIVDIKGLLGLSILWTKIDNEDKIGYCGPKLTKIDKLYIMNIIWQCGHYWT